MRVKKPVRTKTPARAEATKKAGRPARTKKPEGFGSSFGAGAFIIGLVAIVGIAMMLPDAVPAEGHVQPATQSPDAATLAPVTKAPLPDTTPAKVVAPASSTRAAVTATSAKTAPPPATIPRETKPQPADGDTIGAEMPASAPPSMIVSGAVTIDGCMQRNDEGFRLKDTSGEDAPRARSWKSGFLKKGSTPVTLVDVAGAHALASHLGQRVSVTGSLVDREMRVHSLRRIGESCE